MREIENGIKDSLGMGQLKIFLSIGDGVLVFDEGKDLENFLQNQIISLATISSRDDGVRNAIQPLIDDLKSIAMRADDIALQLNRRYREREACLAENISEVIRSCATSAQKYEAISHLLRGRKDIPDSGMELDGAGRTVAVCYELLLGTVSSGQISIELSDIRERHVRQQSDFEVFFNEAKSDWKQRIEGYETKIALGAPREYWKEKGEKHQEKAHLWRMVFLCSLFGSIVAIGALGLELVQASRANGISVGVAPPGVSRTAEAPSRQAEGIKASNKEADSPAKSQEKSQAGSVAEQQRSAQLPAGTGGALKSSEGVQQPPASERGGGELKTKRANSAENATHSFDGATNAFSMIREGIVFATILALVVWGLRQLLRIWLMHEHLEEDAKERVAMIETYAAMKKDGFELQDRSKIVEALYRNATTGLIKEDAGPATPFEVIVKTVADAAQRR